MALPRLILVTGKGGTGKSTVTAALALALSRHRRTLLADLDHRADAARLLDLEQDGAAAGSPPSNLEVMSFIPRAELEGFIERIVPLRMISRRMLRSHTFGYVTAALPGLEAFLMLERLRRLAQNAAERDGFAVIDGPATGGALELLSVSRGVEELAPAGMLNRLARATTEFLTSRESFGVFVTMRPEHLAVREALEATGELRAKLRISYLSAILNGVPAPVFSTAECATIRPLGGHYHLAVQRSAAIALAARARQQLAAGDVAVIELPMLYTAAFGRQQVKKLADEIERSLGQLSGQEPKVRRE